MLNPRARRVARVLGPRCCAVWGLRFYGADLALYLANSPLKAFTFNCSRSTASLLSRAARASTSLTSPAAAAPRYCASKLADVVFRQSRYWFMSSLYLD